MSARTLGFNSLPICAAYGQCDNLPEQAFMVFGTISDAKEKAAQLTAKL